MSPPPPDDDADRDRILARRAIFVTTALAALGCSSQGTPQQTPPPDGSVAAAASSTPAVSATPSATATPVPTTSSLRPWDEVFASAPPLEIAPTLNEADKADLEALKQRLKPGYEALAAAWKAVPTSCGPKDCTKEWAAAAEAIHQARDSIKSSLCGEWGGLGYRQRKAEHTAFIQTITKELEDGLADASLKLGDATTWSRMVSRPPLPQPCLKCAMPVDPGVLGDDGILRVPFAEGAAALAADANLLLESVPLDRPIVIRGHADPGEADGKKLAQARAEAVKKWLLQKGAKAGNLTISSLGADLPIATSQTPEGRAKNRRVDFAYPPEPKR